MTSDVAVPRIPLEPRELQSRFDRLQRKLMRLWPTISAFNDEEQTIVVVPSVSLDFDLHGSEMQAYEERFLFLLLLLRQPRARLVYVTSLGIPQDVIDYYLNLLPGVIPSHARERLYALSLGDPKPVPLTHKILQRPRFIERIRALIPDTDRAHLVPYNTTEAERDLALRLGIPMYGCDPRFEELGSKSGGRSLFREARVQLPYGFENIHAVEEVVSAVQDIRQARPECQAVLAKLNFGVSGEGNAQIDLSGLPADASRPDIERRVQSMTPELGSLSAADFLRRLEEGGGVVEERVTGDEVLSPSVQLRVTPEGVVEILSTHDQLLGGTNGQTYEGCAFPADEAYAHAIAEDGRQIGRQLAGRGVLGRFAVDFLATRGIGGQWRTHAIELNLRKGGTTHPFLTLQFLTDGWYDWKTGQFWTPRGEQKCFVANDHLESPDFRVLELCDLFDILVRHRLHFDQARQKGVVLHMMASLGDCGRFGMTAVGNDREEAEGLYRQAQRVFEEEAKAARRSGPLPDVA